MDKKQRKMFVKHNGLLYLELPIELRDDPYLAYHAYIQNISCIHIYQTE